MTIQDSNPERRNLVVTSLAFIVYFFAGGSFTENEVRLHVVNVHFDKPEILAYIAWFLLFWFLFRYWQKHNGDFSKEFKKEITPYYTYSYFTNYARKKLEKPIITVESEGYHVVGFKLDGNKFGLRYVYATNVNRENGTGKIISWQSRNDDDKGVVYLDDAYGWLLKARAYITCCIKQPSFADYIIPYLLFGLCLVGALYKVVF
ncbi:TPA: hypothetical protein ACTGGT_003544 [Vibrio cholerae]